MKNDSESIIKRLMIILSEYYKLTKDNNNETLANIDWSDLFGPNNNYSDEQLVNDFNYILDIYNDDEDIQNLHNQLLQSITNKENALNDIKEGSILHRHLICDKWKFNTKELISELYFGCKDQNDIIKYKLLDKMYCHIMFPHILGLRLSSKDLNTIQDCSTKDQKEAPELDLDLKLNKLNDILTEKRAIWIELKTKQWMNKYGDDKFVTYLVQKPATEESKSNDSNDYGNNNDRVEPSKSKSNSKKSPEQIEKEKQYKRRISLINEYSIGNRYYYDHWNYYSENREKLKISQSLIIHGSHFPNLKSEMIQSNAMTMEQWLLLQLFCKVLFESNKCKKLKCDILKSDGHGIDIHYGFQQGDGIHLEHIMSLYIYCNFPDIKRRFHRHLTDNKYSNFGRLLRETVEGFGISVFHDDSENQFYHNMCVKNDNKNDESISNRSYFNGYLALKFCKPTMMTTYSNIIHLYNMENKYVTLNLCKYTNNSSVNYFNCNWISDYSLDNECLFIGGKYALKLQSIIIDNIYNYSHYLNAIHILHCLIKGKANILPIDNKLLFAIETLTKNKLQINNKKQQQKVRNDDDKENDDDDDNNINDHNDYIMKIFSKFCQNITIPIYINLIWVLDSSSNGYKPIKQWITNEDNSWIRFDVLCSLFPNVEKVKIGHSQFMLQNYTFDKFIEVFGGNNNDKNEGKDDNKKNTSYRYKLQEIVFEDPNESTVSVKTIINNYQSKLSEIGWKMESNKYYTKIFLKRKNQENLWDDLF